MLDLAPEEIKQGNAEQEPGGTLAEKGRIEGNVAEQPPYLAMPDLGGVQHHGLRDGRITEVGDAEGRRHKGDSVRQDEEGVGVNRMAANPEKRPVIVRLFVVQHGAEIRLQLKPVERVAVERPTFVFPPRGEMLDR